MEQTGDGRKRSVRAAESGQLGRVEPIPDRFLRLHIQDLQDPNWISLYRGGISGGGSIILVVIFMVVVIMVVVMVVVIMVVVMVVVMVVFYGCFYYGCVYFLIVFSILYSIFYFLFCIFSIL